MVVRFIAYDVNPDDDDNNNINTCTLFLPPAPLCERLGPCPVPLFLTQRCGLNDWSPNSRVIRAVSDNVVGPYQFVEEILPTFHHNPSVVRQGTHHCFFPLLLDLTL